jgi:hypothetical protein
MRMRTRLAAAIVAAGIAATTVTPAYAVGGPILQWSESENGAATTRVCAYEYFWIDGSGFPADLASVNITFWNTTTSTVYNGGTHPMPLSNGSGALEFYWPNPAYFVGTKWHVDFHLSKTVHGAFKATDANC